jgi:carboxyl-terminal processing protease
LKLIIVSLLVIVGLILSSGAGCILTEESVPTTETVPTTDSHLDAVKEAWDTIFRDYVDQSKIDANALSQAAIKGMVEALNDPYTAYFAPETYQVFLKSLAGKFEGIGATVGVRDKQIMITAPLPNSPADRAGIRAGDIILGVNGESTEGLSLEEVVLRIRGPKGTPVRVTIQHQGETTPIELEIIRAEIDLPSVSFEMQDGMAYIRILYFSDRTPGELSPVIERLGSEGATGIILDLRGNTGGPLAAGVNVASLFLKEGVVLYVVDKEGKETTYPVKRGTVNTDLPLVVLTDNYTASCSEVLAGAIQDYKRGIVAGTKTYGKGSVNILYQLPDGSALYLTIARWLTPNRRLIEGQGIEPDYALTLEDEAAVQWAINYLKGKK